MFNDVLIRLSQPLLLGQLLMYFREDEPISRANALIYAAGIGGMSVLGALVSNQYTHASHHNGMKVRVAVCSLIYRKALRLSQTSLGQTAAGQMVNLLSNDVNRFDVVSVFVHSMWTAPLVAVVVGCLLYVEVGWAGFVGIAIVFGVVSIQCECSDRESLRPAQLLRSFRTQSLHRQAFDDIPPANRIAD